MSGIVVRDVRHCRLTDGVELSARIDGLAGRAGGKPPARSERSIVASMRSMRNAFRYRWRLWSIAELVGAMREAGFREVEVHDRLGGAIDSTGRLHLDPLGPGDEPDPDWVVYFVARR